MSVFSNTEIDQLERYLKHKFGNPQLQVKPRQKANDSVEVLVAGEFLGVIYKDQDEGETSYDLNMAILDIDLPE